MFIFRKIHPLLHLLSNRWLVGAGIGCLLATNALAQAIPWVVKRTIETLGEKHPTQTIHTWILLLIGLAISQALVRICSRVCIFNAAREIEYDLRNDLFRHLCTLDGDYYRNTRTGDLMSRLTNDLASVRALFGPGVLNIVNTIFAYAVALPLMLTIDPSLTLFALLPFPLLLLCARLIARGIYDRSRGQQRALGAMTAALQEDFAGIRELKGYCLEERRSSNFSNISERYLNEALRLAVWRNSIMPLAGAAVSIGVVLVLWIGGHRVLRGDITLGDLVALNLYVGLLAWPTLAIGWMIALWQRGLASWHRLTSILDRKPTLINPTHPQPIRQAPTKLHTQALTVTSGQNALLTDITVTIPRGTICGIVGKVGSGKSTFIETIARLLPIDTGMYFWDECDVTRIAISDLRSQIGYAPQDAFLFSASLYDNVAVGLGPTDTLSEIDRDQRIAEAISVAGLEPDMAALPDGINTLVGERGVTLSGGQRQRVALARALVARRPILILDDSLSAVDAETEQRILRSLRATLSSTTTILTSHRLSALQLADQIIVLDAGRVVEIGNHASLVTEQGIYAQLYRRQLLELA